ncbi:prefoldin subunit [Ceratocystis lukuohia]|uniref:Prefoldin subunit n=1 Tax=Ceratocystis lukuohia TaxID=2019550 RepID=A0ABR4MAJ7_9PEZI
MFEDCNAANAIDPLLLEDKDIWELIQGALRAPESSSSLPELENPPQSSCPDRNQSPEEPEFDYEKSWSLDDGLRLLERAFEPEISKDPLTAEEKHIREPTPTAPKGKAHKLRSIFNPDNPGEIPGGRSALAPQDALEYMKRFRRHFDLPESNRVTQIIATSPVLHYEQATAVEMLRCLFIEPRFPAPHEYRTLQKSLDRHGYTLENIKEWAWILSGNTEDECVTRLFDTGRGHPFFVLNSLLQTSNDSFVQRQSLSGLIKAVERSFVRDPPIANTRNAERYIANAAILMNLRILLAYSDRQPKSFMLDRKSYVAVRLVLLASEHTPRERDIAGRLQDLWPPYPVPRDGIDEQVAPEENYSRVVKLGMMATEAGFSKTDLDREIDTLGGLGPDMTPTARQRAVLGNTNFSKTAREENIWAAKIRSTRNATEAWAPGYIMPYSASSLPAKTLPPKYLPGDGRELTPIVIPNLTPFERARLTPPSVEQLYEQMKRDGTDADEACLSLLVQEAASVADACRYLEESTLTDAQYEAVAGPMLAENIETLRTVPRLIVSGFIRVLCRKHVRNQVDVELYHRATFYRIQKAVWLAWARFPGRHPSGVSVWRDICTVMSRSPTPRLHPNISEEANMAKLVPLFFRGFFHLVDSYGRDLESAANLFSIIEAYMVPHINAHKNFSLEKPLAGVMSVFAMEQQPPTQSNIPSAREYSRLKSTLLEQRQDSSSAEMAWLLRRFSGCFFNRIRDPGPLSPSSHDKVAASQDADDHSIDGEILPSIYTVPSDAVHRLMRAWAFTGNFAGMARLVRWIATEWTEGDLVDHESASTRERNSIHNALCAFRLFAEPFRPAKEVHALRDLIDNRAEKEDCGFSWPSEVERELYGQGDLLGHAQLLKNVLDRILKQRGIVRKVHDLPDWEVDMEEWWEKPDYM